MSIIAVSLYFLGDVCYIMAGDGLYIDTLAQATFSLCSGTNKEHLTTVALHYTHKYCSVNEMFAEKKNYM